MLWVRHYCVPSKTKTMEISVEKLVRDEQRVETAMDLAEARIFLKYPAERVHKDNYRRFIAKHASKMLGFVVGAPHRVEQDLFWSLGTEIRDGIAGMQQWIKEYEEFYAGNRGPIDEDDLTWVYEEDEDYPEKTFDELETYVQALFWEHLTEEVYSGLRRWEDKVTEETIAEAIVQRKGKTRYWIKPMRVPLNADVAFQLAEVWIPEMLSSRQLAIEDRYNDVLIDITVLNHLQSGEYTTERQAREAAFTEHVSSSGAFVTKNNMPWTLREVIERFAFITEWAKDRAENGAALDKPASLGRLPAEMIRTLYKIMLNMERNQPTSDTLVPRRATTFLENLDMGMEHLVDRINALARPHNVIIENFVKSRKHPVDVSRKRLDHAVSVAKMLLQVVRAQPDGDSARAIVAEDGVRIRTIRRLLVNDMEWLLDPRNVSEFLDHAFNEFGPTLTDLMFVDTPITRESAAKTLDSTIKKWLRNMDATLDMVLLIWNRTKYWVDQRQADGEERMRKKLCLPSTARATRRGQALKAWIATLAGTAKSPDTKPHDSFASVFV